MSLSYFNHALLAADGRWQRVGFLRKWWRFYQGDPNWVPPFYPALRRALRWQQEPYLFRRKPRLLFMEALPRRKTRLQQSSTPLVDAIWERAVAAAVLLHSEGPAAHLGLLRCVNDVETLSRFLTALAEESTAFSFIGPTHLSPYLGAGALASHWHLLPPLNTPYNPPYLPDLLGEVMEATESSYLYHLSLQAEVEEEGVAELRPLPPARLVDDMLPLLTAAVAPLQKQPVPDKEEASFLLRWLGVWPLQGALALVNGEPVGFVLLQPDLAPQLKRAEGGRLLPWRLWLHLASRRPAARGRLLFAGVLPRWRGRGIGRQLLGAAVATGRAAGWDSLTIGPLPENAPAEALLHNWGAERRQQYQLYRWQASSWF